MTARFNHGLHPLIPPNTLTINKPALLKLWSLGIENISQLTSVIADFLLLLLIKDVKSRGQCIFEILNIPLGMQSMPRPDARLRLAGLQHKQQRVQSRDKLGKGHPQDSRWNLGRLIGMK